jgi:hypothetical protein
MLQFVTILKFLHILFIEFGIGPGAPSAQLCIFLGYLQQHGFDALKFLVP